MAEITPLFFRGKYREGITRLRGKEPRITRHWDNLGTVGMDVGIARLCAGHYAKARAIFDEMIEKTRHRMSDHYIYAGMARWFQEDYQEAVSVWRAGQKCQYSGFCLLEFPLLLWYAAVRAPGVIELEESRSLLADRMAKVSDADWEKAVAGFVLRELGEEEVRERSREHESDTRYAAELTAENWTVVDFWAGMLEYQDGEMKEFARLMRRCANALRTGAVSPGNFLHEMVLARHELKLLRRAKRQRGKRPPPAEST